MKPILFIFISLLIFTQANAQLKVNAGNDKKVCFPDKPLEARIQLGGIPAASGGIEPYTYTWSGKLPIYYDAIDRSKSDKYLSGHSAEIQ